MQDPRSPGGTSGRHAPPVTVRSRLVLIFALCMVSMNLRPMLTGLGPLLDSVRDGLGLSGAHIGLLITLPVLCFGAFAPFVPRLLRFMSPERLILVSLAALAVGIGVRSLFGVTGLFLGTFISGASISVVMVMLPGIIKQHFPAQAGMMMGLYSTALCIGAATAAATAVPLEDLLGGWRPALAFWLLPVLAAIPVWQRQVPRAAQAASAPPRPSLPRLRGNWLAWQVTLTMGLQSSIAYCVFGWLPVILIDRGMTPLNAGFALSAALFIQLVSSPLAPWLATRGKDQRPALASMLMMALAGLLCLFYAPIGWVWVSALVMGFGLGGVFSIALALLVLRAPNALVAASLSGMAQGIGYTIAASAPLAMGLLHEYTHSWDAVAALFVLLAVGSLLFGMGAARARYIQVDSRP